MTDSLAATKSRKRIRRKIAAGVQYGALPFRVSADGTVQVMLITSRETRRWVIPKGWPMRKRKPPEVAAQEAYEEAGIVGRIVGARAVGSYHYTKWLQPDLSVACLVKVFLLEVHEQLGDWPERVERETAWFDPLEAAGLVAEPGLARLLVKAASLVARSTG